MLISAAFDEMNQLIGLTMKTFLTAATLLLTLGCVNSAIAETNDTGFYVGGDIGSTQLKILGESDSATSVGAYGGYNFNEWFAIEGHVFGTGDYDTGIVGQDIYGATVTKADVSAVALSIAPKATWHINDTFSAYAKAGISFMKVDLDGALAGGGNTANLSGDYDGWGYVLGAGVNAAITEHLVVRLGYEYMEADLKGDTTVSATGVNRTAESKFDDSKLSQFSLGLHYQF